MMPTQYSRPQYRPLNQIACALFISAVAVVLWGSWTPSSGPSVPGADKILHFGAYGVLSILALLAWPRARMASLIIGVAMVGGMIEMAQHFGPHGREGSFLDQLANTLGAICAGFIWIVLARIKARLSG